MKFRIFKFKKVNSTNDTAIRIIKSKKFNFGMITSDTQKMVEGNMEKNGFHLKEIYLLVSFIL